MIIHGCSLEKLELMDENSIDAVVTDPPYGLSFMGKKWDYDVPSIALWKEVLRVLKPGGHVLSFGGTRTYHRMVVNMEDAGFEIRDQIMWLYGSGFPKSMDVSKAIDKEAGAKREVVGFKTSPDGRDYSTEGAKDKGEYGGENAFKQSGQSLHKLAITAPATDAAKQWQGWGTALKPANEPIVVARKPLEKGLTVAQNVLKWGTGAMNIDGSRIAYESQADFDRVMGPALKSVKGKIHTAGAMTGGIARVDAGNPQGRWPANVLFDEEAAAMLDEQSGPCKTGVITKPPTQDAKKIIKGKRPMVTASHYDISSGASRFFYVAKASKRERGTENNHPTVKPIKLMEYLIKLVTPPNGIVLDPFMGSGTTCVAAKSLGFQFIGIELNEDYFKIADIRIG
jgi:DNA modification methylase